MSLTLEQLFESGAYFGHHKSKKHPAFEKYVFAIKNNILIIDIEQTLNEFRKAVEYLKDSIKQGKLILFVGTKKQAKKVVEETAEELKMPYLVSRWLGGGLTNFITLQASIKKFNKMNEDQKAGRWEKMIKKERLILERKQAKMAVDFKGLKNLSRLPDVLFVVDPDHERVAIAEAKKINIPVVAICDSNFDPTQLAYPIPANDDALKSVKLIVESVGEELKAISSKSKIQSSPKISQDEITGRANEISKSKVQKSNQISESKEQSEKLIKKLQPKADRPLDEKNDGNPSS